MYLCSVVDFKSGVPSVTADSIERVLMLKTFDVTKRHKGGMTIIVV